MLPLSPTRDTPKGTPPKKRKNPVNNKGGDGVIRRNTVGLESLNPPFDARMRRVGSPDQKASDMRRGWIQVSELQKTSKKKNSAEVTASGRVNFLFNPSQATVSHAIDPNAPNPKHVPAKDTTQFQLYGSQSTVSIDLLYDRTYEMFSQEASVLKNSAHYWGMYADVAAWYKLLMMIDDLPPADPYFESRVNGVIVPDTSKWLIQMPLNRVMTYLYLGPRMIFFGYVNTLDIVYSHWSQHMIPIRGQITVGYTIVPEFHLAPDLSGAPNYPNGVDPDRDKHTSPANPQADPRAPNVPGGSK